MIKGEKPCILSKRNTKKKVSLTHILLKAIEYEQEYTDLFFETFLTYFLSNNRSTGFPFTICDSIISLTSLG